MTTPPPEPREATAFCPDDIARKIADGFGADLPDAGARRELAAEISAAMLDAYTRGGAAALLAPPERAETGAVAQPVPESVEEIADRVLHGLRSGGWIECNRDELWARIVDALRDERARIRGGA